MRTPDGLHLPNGPNIDIAHWVDVVGSGCYTVLDLQRYVLPELRRLASDALILVRFYCANWRDWTPEGWAKHCADLYRRDIRPYTKHITWANEQNLGAESGNQIGATDKRRATQADYETIHDWNQQFITAWLLEGDVSDAILHYPAFAAGHSDDQDDYGFVGLRICSDGIRRVPFLDRHIYWNVDGGSGPKGTGVAGLYGSDRIQLTRELFPDKQLFISETGNFAVTDPRSPSQYAAVGRLWSAIKNLLGWTFFIADDPTGAHRDNDMSRNSAIFDAIKAERLGRTLPVSQAERERYFADLFKRFNAVYNVSGAIEKEWTRLANSGVWLGPPMEPEHKSENGTYIFQAFSGDVLSYNTTTGTVARGLPPLT